MVISIKPTLHIRALGTPIDYVQRVSMTIWEPGRNGAPRLQPVDTRPATAGDHCGGMVTSPTKKGKAKNADAEPVAPLRPAREVGWIFKNGEDVAIERRECESRESEDAS